jgi:hypothetical protein
MTWLDTRLSRRSVGWILFALFLLLWAALAKAYTTYSWQEESRLATIQALVEQGTFIIDHSEFNRTGDKIFINGHFYSDKTPPLSIAAAGFYSILYNVFGLTLDTTVCLPDKDPAACRLWGPDGPRFTAFYWLNLVFMGIPSALLVALFWKAMIERQVRGSLATGMAIALGIASPIGPYSLVFTSHIPASAALFVGLMLLARPPARRGYFWAGLWLGIAANIDLLLAVFVATFGIWVLLSRRSMLLPFVLGVLIPFAVGAASNYWIAGSFLPLYFDPKAYDFPGTVLNTTVGGTNGFYSLQFGLRYAYDLLIGRHGVFAYTPLFLYAVAGMWAAIRSREHPLRAFALAALSGCLLFTAYLIARTDNFAGVAWGVRWFTSLTPLAWYFGAFLFDKPHGRVWWAALAAAVIVSAWTVTPGLHNTWQEIKPVFYLELTAFDYP